MSRPPAEPASTPEERIVDIDVSSEMQTSFLEYAYSVIYSRALPDARDGLKPVQRRILYQMREMGLRPDRGHVKSARVVGDVMGRLHPHGDTAIYDALVRLAQPFVQRVRTIDGHGNFGSLDDAPAAPRYTEARLDASAMAMTDDLDEDTVDFIPNYDNSIQQPEVLPAAWPHLLVNGASGIAVGMATNMAPHNLGEVIAGARHLLEHPDATLDEVMAFIPGPDLPSGGIIVGLDGIREAYASGRGAFRTRAAVSIERVTARKQGIVVTELPYLVGTEKVIEKIKDGVQSKKLAGIADVADFTDRTNGMRLVIEIKTGFAPEAVLEQLYRYTPLEDTFHINNVALVDGGPQTLGLLDLLRVYLKHRMSVVRRRSTFRLARRRERLHLVEGLLIAIVDIDEVIQIIRSSDDGAEASTRLQQVFDLSEAQSEYILELRLRRLTKFSRIELEAEADELRRAIAELEALLADETMLRRKVSDELAAVAEQFATPRRTVLTEAAAPATGKQRKSAAPSAEELRQAEAPTRVIMSATGRILRVDVTEPGAPIPAARRRSKHDAIAARIETTVHGSFGIVTNRGRLLRLPVVALPSAPAASVLLSAGVKARDYAGLTDRGERVVGLVPVDGAEPIALVTALGVVKRVVLGDLGKLAEADIITLKQGDEVLAAAVGRDEDELVLVADDAQLLHFPASAVRPQGRPAAGMAGIKLADGARVLAARILSPAETERAEVVTIATSTAALPGTDTGSAKVSPFAEFPAKGRATGGVRAHRFTRGEDRLRLAWVGAEPRAVAADGAVRDLPAGGAKRDGSGAALEASIDALGGPVGDAAALGSDDVVARDDAPGEA
ncbi:DNA topoisomerase (ATP-hydrolyzing) [Pseudoclavibacter endophyticus]|uniref:DNA topoisomerase (ATP-hydrolyzing) n=1 Tax=Pseudoclavibacter endophyticus TaxID=1778590 RepID=A0A6H9WPI4_9MICO|nr:DNA topoisomerase IV subunit A [Pseudoclavibacter endophyticus]KAB1650028.1 DNA topoisomerase IV subunit A [Pseudoclavibacter endophyticus]GGA57834.1 DNA topoisomerase (ATP-hydrolyzing) [Pseudoclavibacter endophyticus]